MFTRIVATTCVLILCLVPITLAEGGDFSTISFRTLASCEGYNPLEQFASVSPVMPLRLQMNSLVSDPKVSSLYFNLQDPTLGVLSAHQGGILEVAYQKSGTTRLIGQIVVAGKLTTVVELPIEFLAKRDLKINLYYVYDAEGHKAWKLKQSEMLATLQTAEKILNQAGISIQIESQQDLYVPQALGLAINASAIGQSQEEAVIIRQASLSTDIVSVFVVWDYQLNNESKAGMNYLIPDRGQVIFITEKTSKPAETLAHELMHSLGLGHTELGDAYLMSADENPLLTQCLFSRAELQHLAQTR